MSATIMADVNMTAESPRSTPRKRNHRGELIDNSLATSQGTADSKSTNEPSHQASPALSNTSSELTELTSIGFASPTIRKVAPDGTPHAHRPGSLPAEKRKLTFAEKEVEKAVKNREKEERAKQKADEKTRKEEERRQKEEERRQKEEERRKKGEEKEAEKRSKELDKAEKKKARDAEKQEKEAERARKEVEKKEKEMEKMKKERSQLRIGVFFGRPAPQSTPPATPDDVSSRASSRRSSVAAIDVPELPMLSSILKLANPEFEKYIIPYFIHEHTEVAPVNRFRAARETGSFGGMQSEYQLEIEKPVTENLRARFGPPRKRMRIREPVKEIVDRIQATELPSVDLTGDYNPLARMPCKILSFREDVRPPYVGTYTKSFTPHVARRLSRKPNYRARTDINYDYDSEAEWEEPAVDDEEILDDEMSESEDGDEEMIDFLDDENDQGRRRIFAGEMEPVSSGLCFQGENYDSNGHNMEHYRIDVLHDSTTFPIDPYSNTHWSDIGKVAPPKLKPDSGSSSNERIKNEPVGNSMLPPRVPLATVSQPNTLNGYLSPGNAIATSQNENAQIPAKQRGRLPAANKDLKIIPAEFLDAFKSAVNGSDLTKAGLIEVLKKQFPKCSKDAIKDTLGVIAIRIGKKEAEKKWELNQ